MLTYLSRRQLFMLATVTILGALSGRTKAQAARTDSSRPSDEEIKQWLAQQEALVNQQPATALEAWMLEVMRLEAKGKAPGGLVTLTKFREPMYCVREELSWTPKPGQTSYQPVMVPRGFVTDLTSIPRIFYSVLRPDGPYAHAAIIHDYLYWTQTRPKAEADEILKLGMEEFGLPSLTVWGIYKAVDWFGDSAWEGNRRLKAEGERRVLRQLPCDPRMSWEKWKQRDVFQPGDNPQDVQGC